MNDMNDTFEKKHFSHVNGIRINKLVTSKMNKTNKNLKFKSKSILTKNYTIRQFWRRKSFTEDIDTS